ncbi:MAG: nuclear transport factor 2 family protein [Pseudomonadota bacterium]
MALKDLADKLIQMNKDGQVEELLANHYAADAVSVEAAAMNPEMGREAVGLDAIRAKHAWWEDTMEVNGWEVDGPYLHGEDRFSVLFEVDATTKATGERMKMKEIAVYHVAGDKVVREEFFYGTDD